MFYFELSLLTHTELKISYVIMSSINTFLVQCDIVGGQIRLPGVPTVIIVRFICSDDKMDQSFLVSINALNDGSIFL